ncbi:MarR family winged helix-turn-helix transcriptional regulator [Frigidibacter sp. ROC022]|uniref:MarR family winged helix-turn-helix transcriptional regulator n=1 Tax=Frigidibacter sp. ROC022 TaxID=2971796 RepID=UPI00215A6798|nr:MarR family winged helix-turn-helix transcriptional regulator [Frigidibacter sp. ROC022]MCR8726541.1 MarR family winged helix-turn-helix transcriptional regulator [Frigidibacter sp. ROC022]
MHFLLHAADLVEDSLRRRLSDIDLGPRQARVLDALAKMGSASQVELAQLFDITAASMSTMTARLIAAGLVSRQTDPAEARRNVLRLSPRGKGLLDEIHAAWDSIDKMIEEKIGPEKAATLAELTRELRDSLGGRAPEASGETG